MKLILANPRGFCAGVYMAIDVVDQLLDICEGEKIYVYHEIVHNRHVVDRFRERGVHFVDDVEEVPEGSIVVFSAHGVSPAIRAIARARRLTAIDATCPLVTKVHAEAIRYARKGYQILLIGHADHQEVVGTRGEVPDAIQVVQSPADIPRLEIKDPARLVYLTQTTLSMDDAAVIIGALQKAFPQIKSPPSEDICYATTNRQGAVRALAADCDLVLVVGSRNSSNSVRLTEIAEALGTPARLVDDRGECRPEWFDGVETVLVTAGASAPEDLVEDLIQELIDQFGGEVEQHDIHREEIEFGLPGSLKEFMRSRGVDPTGRRITRDTSASLDRWLQERGIPHRTIDLTIKQTDGPAHPELRRRVSVMLSFFDITPPDLEAHCREHGMPRHIADQVFDWVYRKNIVDPALMTNVSAANRRRLADTVAFDGGTTIVHQTATDGTEKLLIEWPKRTTSSPAMLPVLNDAAGPRTECVMIPTERRRTACISSQVGCPVGCTFCASGLGGLEGNLRAGQIVEQVHRLGRLEAPGTNARITNVVFMGMGEPLANFGAVTRAIRTINAPWGLGIGARKITISTVGLPKAIRKLVDFDIPVTLALSLHAPNDALRQKLIPWAEYAPIDALVDACAAYFEATGREITFEYLLLRGVNDRVEHAHELAEIARRLRANVNLIRYNEVRGLPYDRPTSRDVIAFQEALKRRRVNVHIRASRGRDIAAACGQLRHETVPKSPGPA